MPDVNFKGLDNRNLPIDQALSQDQTQAQQAPKWNLPALPLPSSLEDSGKDKKENSVEDSFANSIKSLNSPQDENPHDNEFIQESKIPVGTKEKFDKGYAPGYDNEDAYGQQQSAGEKALYAIPRILGAATKTIVQGLAAPIVGLGYLALGGNFVKNDFNDFLEGYDKWTDTHMPLFATNAEKNSSFIGQVKYGNSWIHLGEFVGMGAGIAGTAWLTGGASEAALGAMDIAQGTRLTANYLNSLDKLAESTSIISKLDVATSKEVIEALLSKASSIWSQSIGEGEKLDQLTATLKDINKTYASNIQTLGKVKNTVYGAASMLGMNAGMGAQANTRFSEDLINEIREKEGRDATPEEKDKIQKMAQAVGQWTFGLGTVMSAFSFHGLLKGMIGKDAEKVVLNEINSISGAAGKYTENKLPFTTEVDDNMLSKGTKYIANKGYQIGKFTSKLVDPWAGIGLTEFSLMEPSVESYYKKKYATGKADLIEDALGPNIDKIFTKEGMSTFFMGMVGAGPMEMNEKFKESKKRALNTKAAITSFNNNTAKTFLNDNMESIIRDKSLKDTEVKALQEGDNFTIYNTREQRLINYIFPRIKYGMRDLITKELKTYRDQLSNPEGIASLQKEFNIEGKPEDIKKQIIDYLDHMESISDKMESNYKAISLRYRRIKGFNDSVMEKLLYLSQMTDNATDRVKKLASELTGDKRLSDKILNTTEGSDWKTGYFSYEPTIDIQRLLTAESKNTIIRSDEGEKKVKAHDVYDALHEKIDNLLIPDNEKEELRSKLNDMVLLNSTRRQYLKQYHDITNDPAKHADKRVFNLINPYAGEYDADTRTALNNVLAPKVEGIDTRTGKKAIELGTEYYSGTPIQFDDFAFRKFKVIKELDADSASTPEDIGKLLIETDKGDKLTVDRDFLKKHDVDKTINMSSQAKFYDRNSRKRMTRTTKDLKEAKKETIDAKLESNQEEREWAIKESEEAFRDKGREIRKQLDQVNQALQEGKGGRDEQRDLQQQKLELIRQGNLIIPDHESEFSRIHKFYDEEQKRLEDYKKELDRDPKDYLKEKALAAYNKAIEEIKAKSKEDLDKVHELKQRDNRVDFDYEKDKIKNREDAKIEALRVEYRNLYDQRLKELENKNREVGVLEYSPTDDKLHFVSHAGEKHEISTDDLKNGVVSKMDKSPWSKEDKDFIDNYKDEKIAKAEKEKFDKLGDEIVKDQTKSTQLYEINEIPLDSVPQNLNTTQKEVNNSIGIELDEKGGPKKTIGTWYLSSVPVGDGIKEPYRNPFLNNFNKFAHRAESFFHKLTSESFQKKSQLKDKKGDYIQPQVIYVHGNNQDILGLSGLISTEDITKYTGAKAPVMMVMVHTDENNQLWTISGEGKKLKKIGDNHVPEDFNNMIFTYLQPAVSTWDYNGKKGYRDLKIGTPEEIKAKEEATLKSAEKYREDILNNIYNKPLEIIISNSIPETYSDHSKKTAIDQTGLTDKAPVTGDIQVATNHADGSASITIPGIDAKGQSVKVKPGWAYWIRRGAVELLNRKQFTPKDSTHIYKCIEYLCKDMLRTGKLNVKVREYLSSVVFFNSPSEKDILGGFVKLDSNGFPILYDKQLAFFRHKGEGINDQYRGVWLLLGKDKKLPFNLTAIGDDTKNTVTNRTGKKEIIDFLNTLSHSVLNKKLKDPHEYTEITGFDDKGELDEQFDKVWKNYTQYLSSSTDPDGNKREVDDIPLTTNIVAPTPDAHGDPIPSAKGKYITVKNNTVPEKNIPEKKVEPVVSQPIITPDITSDIEAKKNGIHLVYNNIISKLDNFSTNSFGVAHPKTIEENKQLLAIAKLIADNKMGIDDEERVIEYIRNRPVAELKNIIGFSKEAKLKALESDPIKPIVPTIGDTYDYTGNTENSYKKVTKFLSTIDIDGKLKVIITSFKGMPIEQFVKTQINEINERIEELSVLMKKEEFRNNKEEFLVEEKELITEKKELQSFISNKTNEIIKSISNRPDYKEAIKPKEEAKPVVPTPTSSYIIEIEPYNVLGVLGEKTTKEEKESLIAKNELLSQKIKSILRKGSIIREKNKDGSLKTEVYFNGEAVVDKNGDRVSASKIPSFMFGAIIDNSKVEMTPTSDIEAIKPKEKVKPITQEDVDKSFDDLPTITLDLPKSMQTPIAGIEAKKADIEKGLNQKSSVSTIRMQRSPKERVKYGHETVNEFYIPEDIAKEAYAQYIKKEGDAQSYDTIIRRGGFGIEELNELVPDWAQRTLNVELKALEAKSELSTIPVVEEETKEPTTPQTNLVQDNDVIDDILKKSAKAKEDKKLDTSTKKGGRVKPQMEVVPGKYPIENIKGFTDWLKSVLPQFNVESFPELLKNSKGGLSWGQYDPMYRRIDLSEKGIEGVGFHEAFHAVFDSFLSDKQQASLINEFKNRSGQFTTRFGDKFDFNDRSLTDEQIIEQLADDFREHQLTNKVYDKEPVKMGFFKRLMSFLKNWISGKPARMENLFQKINAGYFKDASIYDRNLPTRDMTVFPDGRTAKQNVIRDFQDGVMSELRGYLGNANGGMIAFSENPKNAGKLFDAVKVDLNEKLSDPMNYTVWDKTTNDYRDVTDIEAHDFLKSMNFLTKVSTDVDGNRILIIDDKNWEYLLKNSIEPKLKLFKLSIGKEKIEDVSKTEKSEQEKIGGDSDNITDLGISPEEESYESSSKNTYDNKTFQTDAKDTAPAEIQFFFNTIIQTIAESVPNYNDKLELPASTPSPLLLNKMVEDNSLFYKTMHVLSGCSDLDEMENRFRELAKKVPDLVAPYTSLFNPSTEEGQAREHNMAEWQMLLMLHKTFAKQTPEALFSYSDEQGNTYYRQSDAATVSDQIHREWESNFKDNSELSTQIDTTPNLHGAKPSIGYAINQKLKLIDPEKTKNVFNFLQQIGFKAITKDQIDTLDKVIEDPTISKVEKKLATKLKYEFIDVANKVYKNFVNAQRDRLPLQGRDFAGSGTSLRRLSEIAAQLNRDKFQSQYLRPDGENVQKNINHNYYSRILSYINECQTLDQFFEQHPEYKNDTYVQNSFLLKKGGPIFDEEGKIRDQQNLTVNNGHKNSDGDTSTTDIMTGVQRALSYLNGIISDVKHKGVFNVFMPADQATDFGMKLEHYISKNLVKDSPATAMKKYHGFMHRYLLDEINLIKDSTNRNKFQDLNKIVNDPINKIEGKRVSEQLRYFKNILPPELVKLFTEYANKEGDYKELSYDDLLKQQYDKTISVNDKNSKTIGQILNDNLSTYLEKKIDQEFSYFTTNLILNGSDTKGYIFDGLNTDLLSEFGHVPNTDGKFNLTRDDVRKILRFRMFNTDINSFEFSKLFYGDPANYKDFLKRAKLYNSATETTYMDRTNTKFNKTANVKLNKVGKVDLKATDWGYRVFDNLFSGLTFNWGDSNTTKTVPSSIGELKEIFKGHPDYDQIIDAFENGNSIDAQSYNIIDHVRELAMKSGGVWKKNHEKVFQYLKALERSELHKRLESKEKGLTDKIGRDSMYDRTKEGELSAHGKKLMQADEELLKNKLDEKAYEGLLNIIKYLGAGNSEEGMVMNNGLKTSTLPLFYDENLKGSKLEDLYFFMLKNKIDYTGPESQHKFGKRMSSPILFNTGNTTFDDLGSFNLHSLPKEQIDQASYKMPMDQFNKIVETAGNHEKTSMGTQLRVLATMDLLDNGIPKDFYDVEQGHKFHEKLFEWNKLSPEQKREKSELYAIHQDMNKVLNTMISQGGSKVQETLGIKMKGDKPYLADAKKLKNYLVEMCNTYNIPDNIKKALQISKDANGHDTVLIDQLPNSDSLSYIVHSIIDKHIVRQKVNGGSKILVAGDMFEQNNRKAVYKDASGNWKEVTKDNFDQLKVNKTPMMLTSNDLKFYTLTKDGKTLQGMEVLINNHFKEEMRNWDKKNGKELISDQELLGWLNKPENESLLNGIGFRIPTQGLNSVDVFRIKGFTSDRLGDSVVVPAEITTKVGSDFDVDKLNTYIKNFELNEQGLPTVMKFNDEDWSKNSQESLHNKYIDLLQKVLLHPDNKTRLLTPNTTKIFTDLEKEIAPIKNVGEEKDKSINYANQLNTLWVNRKRQEFLEGKALTSIAASGNTAHAMFQNMNIYLKNGVSLKLNHNQIEVADDQKVTSFSQVKNIKGQYISDLLSQIINGTVDVANDSWLMRLLPSKSLFSQSLFLMRAGCDPREVFYFLNQPIIQEYIKLKDKNSNLSSEEKNTANKKLVKTIETKFEGGSESDLDKFTIEDMKKALTEWHSDNGKTGAGAGELNKVTNNAFQRQILTEFLKNEKLSQEMLVMQQGGYWGNIKKATDALVYLKNNSYDKGINSENFAGLKEGMENTWFGTLRNEVTTQSNIIGQVVFKTSLPQARNVLEPIYKYFANKIMEGGIDAKERLISKAKSNLLDYMVQNCAMDKDGKFNTQIKKLFINEHENLQKRLMQIKKAVVADPNLELNNNSVIKKLIGNPKASPNDPHTLELDSMPSTVNAKDDFTSSLEELNDSAGIIDPDTKQPIDIKQFVQDLYKFGLLQSGIKKSRISWNALIPHEDYTKHVKQAVDALITNDDVIKKYDALKVFWRTNWKDDNIVPKEYKSLIQGLNSGNLFVSLPKFRSDSPVIKTVKPIIIFDEKAKVWREITKPEIAARKNINRKESFYTTRLFQKVMDGGVPYEIQNGEYTNVMYKEVNAWGDGQFMQEHYSEAQSSILDKNLHVNEISDEEFINNHKTQGVQISKEHKTIVPEENEVDESEFVTSYEEEEKARQQQEADNVEPDWDKIRENNERKYMNEDNNQSDPSDINEPGETPTKDCELIKNKK